MPCVACHCLFSVCKRATVTLKRQCPEWHATHDTEKTVDTESGAYRHPLWHPKEAGSLASKGRGILGIQRKRDHGHPKEEGGLFRCSIQRKRNSSYAAVSVASRRRGIPLPLLSVLCPPPPPLCFVNISPSLLP